MTWSITVGDGNGDNHVLVIPEIPGVLCWCGRTARSMIGLQIAFCDRCAKKEITGAGKEPGYVAVKN